MTKCARPRNKKKQSALENFAISQKGFLETQTFFYSFKYKKIKKEANMTFLYEFLLILVHIIFYLNQ